jgi:hypothetical protein
MTRDQTYPRAERLSLPYSINEVRNCQHEVDRDRPLRGPPGDAWLAASLGQSEGGRCRDVWHRTRFMAKHTTHGLKRRILVRAQGPTVAVA